MNLMEKSLEGVLENPGIAKGLERRGSSMMGLV
jgi:hypothetical protein